MLFEQLMRCLLLMFIWRPIMLIGRSLLNAVLLVCNLRWLDIFGSRNTADILTAHLMKIIILLAIITWILKSAMNVLLVFVLKVITYPAYNDNTLLTLIIVTYLKSWTNYSFYFSMPNTKICSYIDSFLVFGHSKQIFFLCYCIYIFGVSRKDIKRNPGLQHVANILYLYIYIYLCPEMMKWTFQRVSL